MWPRTLVLAILCVTPLQAFHADDVKDFRCSLCNASYYCTAGQRYVCPANSLAILYADTVDECVCNPGFLKIAANLSANVSASTSANSSAIKSANTSNTSAIKSATASMYTFTCALGSAPAWYLYGQKNSCPATKGVAWDGSSSVEDCVCLPGYASQGGSLYTPCLSCPVGTYSDQFNSSQCTLCPANSGHNSTRQANISACVCNSGFTGPVDGQCVPCAEGTFKATSGSAACTKCPNGTGTYEYPRTACQCHKGFANIPSRDMFSNNSLMAILSQDYSVVIANPPRLGTRVARTSGLDGMWRSYNPSPTYFAAGGYMNGPYLKFGKGFNDCKNCQPGAQTAFQYMDATEKQLSFGNGITVVFVLRFVLYDLPGMGHFFQIYDNVNRYQGKYSFFEFWMKTTRQLCFYSKVDVSSTGVDCEICTVEGVPFNVWLRVSFVYNPFVVDRSVLTVQYSTATGSVVNMQINTRLPWCQTLLPTAPIYMFMVLGHASNPDWVARNQGGSDVDPRDLGIYANTNRPDFDLAGWYFLQTAASNADIANMFSAIAFGTHVQDLPAAFMCQACPATTYKDYIGNLRATDIRCTICDANAQSPSQSESASACLCAAGFYDNGNNTCQQCTSGRYKGSVSNHSQDLEPCQLCPGNSSSKTQSTSIEDCLCIPGFEGPRGGPCVACAVGKFKANNGSWVNGSLYCSNCSLHTWSDETGMTTCKSCQALLQSPGGATEREGESTSESCFCRPGYVKTAVNGTAVCAACAPGSYTLTKDLAECTACPLHTYTDPALFPWDVTTDCRVCRVCNTSTNATFIDHYDAARGGMGCGESSVQQCTPCPSASSLFVPTSESQRNFGVRSCACDPNFYGAIGTACTACPTGQVRPAFLYENTTLADCLCGPGYEPNATANMCRQCPAGTFKSHVGDDNCSACPDTFTTEKTGNANASACVCAPGYVYADNKCIICPENTHKAGFNLNTTCNTCTANSFGPAGGTGPLECFCYARYAPQKQGANDAVCQICSPGFYQNDTVKLRRAVEISYLTLNPAEQARSYSSVFRNDPVGTGHARSMLDSPQAWSACSFCVGEWMQIDMGKARQVAGVIIQPRSYVIDHNLWTVGSQQTSGMYQYATEIGVSQSLNNVVFNWAQKCAQATTNCVRFFPTVQTCSDWYGTNPWPCQNPPKENIMFLTPVEARYIRIYVYNYNNHLSTRAGLLLVDDLFKCAECSQNYFNNNSGSVSCEACAAGKTTDGRTAQVECVCDVGTEPGADGVCQTCRPGSYKAATTDKYANRACVNCSRCAANQQVNTECNSTLDITCKACQANSWSPAGRTLLEPCLCNAGYELQGQLCVACPAGKARQANNNNSIMCETCLDGTFTSVTATVSCGACSAICNTCVKKLVYDFAPYRDLVSWKNYATSIGATFAFDTFIPGSNAYGVEGVCVLGCGKGWIQLTLPSEYTELTVNYYNTGQNNIYQTNHPWITYLLINGVIRSTAPARTARQYSQTYTSPTILRIEEECDGLGAALVITLQKPEACYVKTECNASRDVICQPCQLCTQGFYANNTCGANYSNDRLDTQCVPCPNDYFCPGTSSLQQALLCSEQRCGANQQVATLCNATHNVTCRACQANSWSLAGSTQLGPCLCNAGYELQGLSCVACPVGKARQANYNNSILCEVCAAGTLALKNTSVTCSACSAQCTPPVCTTRSITYNFAPYSSLESWISYASSIGASTSLTFLMFDGLGIPSDPMGWFSLPLPSGYNNVQIDWYATYWGYTVLQIDGVTKAQADSPYDRGSTGPIKTYTQNYVPGQVLYLYEVGSTIGRALKITLRSTCQNVSLYVHEECNATRDIICKECQTCRAGFYANNTCGANYSNGRLDTQCVLCPAGSYCPGGNVSQLALPCPDNGQSPPGSSSAKACDCDPGAFRNADGCGLCPFDAYCPGKQVQFAVSCPPFSRTMQRGSTLRLDCHCARGYFRDPPWDETGFNCSLCLPGDFCFNNSAYNCSDPLMESAPGSGFVDNCTCVSRFYNNGSVCVNCPVDHYCVQGKKIACAWNEWTNGQERADTCLCRPGFFRPAGAQQCIACSDDFYCDGLDDGRQACPPNAVARNGMRLADCLCNKSFGAVFGSNASEPHSCYPCAPAISYKSTVGNTQCLPCTQCLPSEHSAWTQIECTPRADALCDTCTVCYNASQGGVRTQYTTSPCQQFFDAECANCSVCEREREWQVTPCSETEDATCAPLTFGRVCPVGFYAGGHTATTDSKCLPCSVRNAPYEGRWLHQFTSAGRTYNNSLSCALTCRAFSRLVNSSDVSFGCTTCETGNVLFKVFTQNDAACEFTCLDGYTRRGNDCVLAAQEGNELTFANHSLNVTNVRREQAHASNGSGAFLLTVSHTSHGYFAVVVGASRPSCTSRLHACCFAQLWRVSTPAQLGLSPHEQEACSRSNAPKSLAISSTQLEFEIPDARLTELANCTTNKASCVVYVSIVDTILLQHVSVPVRLDVTRAAALATIGAQTYVPLASFKAEVQLAYQEEDGRPVFVVVTDMQPLLAAGITEVQLHGHDLELVLPALPCDRYLVSDKGSNVSQGEWALDAQPARSISFLRADSYTGNNTHDTHFVKLFYTLRLREREGAGVKNTMHVAVWRNISLLQAVCEAPQPASSVLVGNVLGCNGLGELAVAAATALHEPTETVRGEVGGLTSFVANAQHQHVRSVRAGSVLLAYALLATLLTSNVTQMTGGTLEFTEDFRKACVPSLCHLQYAHEGRGMHFMTSCDATAQAATRAWLTASLGVVHDDGHVQALCRLAHPQYAFLITLVNTRAYLPRTAQWHQLQNRSAPQASSTVYALFHFT